MNWNAGRPIASNDWWSVPNVGAAVSVVAPRSRTGASQRLTIGRTDSLPSM